MFQFPLFSQIYTPRVHNLFEGFSKMGFVEVAGLVCFWYGSSVVNNVWTKRMLAEGFVFPFTATWLGMVAQLCALLTIRALKTQPATPLPPPASTAQLLPVSCCQILGNLLHKFALMRSSIPVVHTVKSLTAVVTALLAFAVTGDRWPSTTAIAMMIGGVAYAMSADGVDSEQFVADMLQASPAFVCVLADSLRVVLGKRRIAANPTGSLIKLQMLSIAMFLPVVSVQEGARLQTYIASAAAGDVVVPWSTALLSISGVAGMELGNFFALSALTPISHAMANSMRSLVLVGAGVFFGAQVTYVKYSFSKFLSAVSIVSGKQGRYFVSMGLKESGDCTTVVTQPRQLHYVITLYTIKKIVFNYYAILSP